MALPISSPARPQLHSQDTLRPASSSQLSVDVAAHRRRSPSCSLTIFKGIAGAHISAHNPIVSKPAGPQPPAASNRGGGRFAGSFAGLGQHQASPQGGNDEAVNVHAVTDDGILLPFIDRPTEVEELLFDTKTNEPLLQRLCRVFGGSLQQPTRRGISEAWDELLEILVGTDRAILDDEDWLVRLETIIMDRSAELWGQLQRCLGADGLLLDASAHASVVRYDSWADGDARSDGGSDSPGSEPATPISEALPSSSSVEVDVRALYELPPSYYKQPVGKLRRPSMHDDHAEASLDAPSLSPRALRDQITSPSSPSLHLGEPLADIMEEPPKAGAVPATRPRSYSGKFAGLRIQAGPQHGARSPSTSSLSPGMGGRTSNPSSPLPTGVMSPAGPQRGGSALSPGAVDPSSPASTSFSHPRRLSLLAPAGGGGEHARHHHHRPDQQQGHHHRQQLHDTRDKALRADHPHPYGASSHGHSPTPSSLFDGHRQPRRRAMSFARSFAHLHSAMPTEASGSELAKQRAPAAAAERPRFRHQKSHSISHGEGISALEKPDAPAAPPQGLGLLPDGRTQHPSAGASSRARAMSMANPDTGHGLSPFPDHAERTRSTSDKTADSSSASIPGLLPDGRTRHPSGSQGSKDLSESIAAFRATMGLSTSPSGGARNEIKEESPAATVSEQRSRSRSRSRSSSPVSKPAAAAAATAPSTSPKGKAASRPSSHLPQSSPYYQQSAEAGSQPRQGAPSAGGSGLALGGGFSLAKSGANFKRPDAGPVRSLSNGSLGVSARYAGRGAGAGGSGGALHHASPYNFHSPPPVHRRPGGFASLAHEYDSAKRSRRATSESVGSVFSFQSNAVASSPGSSVASLDAEGSPQRTGLYHDGDDRNQSISPVSRIHAWSGRQSSADKTPLVRPFGPAAASASASETPGQSTPRASMSMKVGFTPSGYPFPPTSTVASSASAPSSKDGRVSPRSEARAPLPKPHHLAPSPHAACFLGPPGGPASGAPRSPSLVFPVSSDSAVSRARELGKKLDTDDGRAAGSRVASVCGDEAWSEVRGLILQTERSDVPDEALLESIGKKMRLVDHQEACKVGGREQDEADAILAEEGYGERWEAFAALCHALGVGQFEIGLAKRRCGPAIELVGSAAGP